jgi:RNA recognition motif-containing protein
LKPDFREQFRETASTSKIIRYKMNTKLYVGNLSFDTTENDLQDLFQQHGPVSEVNLITDRMTGRSRGFAFVTMGTPEAAQAAITALSGKDIQGRALTVNEARPREEHGGGGGGGGGGRRNGGGGGGGGGGRRQFSRR